ncbi:4-hydroxyphenylacetate decarboxylase activating enzyme [Caloramator mitchellensis]|uniref:4-hydroxyphenylacetate decarboxylase activating enzyme n=1 Tax=Caloramator mitchellensis TaxID=908809 RepID=A0A0R3JRU4_CALMK|nr:YjjW family glycine radical enzyme activase [Caloramator mitchellensis]KRQ86185.1 4-hydroxyphenylacetate decarboxylase activating enzyme [Caloramator mitchellensis]
MKALVNKIIPFSSVDGPGNRTAIFLQGCNFNCLYCHNPETINICNDCGTCVTNCPYNAIKIENGKVNWQEERCVKCDRCIEVCPSNSSPKVKKMNIEEILSEIEKFKPFISGITVSGGECLLQNKFLGQLFKKVKRLGLTCFVDTNGYIPFKEMPELTNLMDDAMLDVKSIDEEEHYWLTGKSNKTVIENINFLGSIDKLYEVRTVIVPEVLDNERNVREISKILASINKEIRYKIIKFRPLGVKGILQSAQIPSEDMMNNLKSIALNEGLKKVIIK